MSALRQRHVGDATAPAAAPAATSPAAVPPAAQSPVPDADAKAARERDATATPFDCNICLDMPNDPVVTACGHLYCWSCLYKWMRLHAEAPQCPVCKASVERQKVTPIYGRGRSTPPADPRVGEVGGGGVDGEALPPRPVGQRDVGGGVGGGPPFGFHPAAFGRVNAYGTYGLFPSLFGMQIAYPHLGDGGGGGAAGGRAGVGGGGVGREVPDLTPQLTPEEETQEQVVRVFLFLAFFIVCSVSFF